jgi:hypothetical protein
MKIQVGWRYRAVVLGEGEFEGLLLGPAGVDVWREGGGEVHMPRWQLRLDDGSVIEVQEAELAVLNPRGLGDQGGPVSCPACEGKGSRPKPDGISLVKCGNCDGEGILYPDG